MKFDLNKIEKKTLDGLKDFQRATVERIDALYRCGQNRVLIADEVGLGKTLIARGAIAKMARMRMEQKDKLFKVIYICSNQIIAKQNISKLDIVGSRQASNISDTRLSMQHLKITQQENDETVLENYIQLIPLTPDTSFRMTSGTGNVSERALMYAILRRVPWLSVYENELEDLFEYGASVAWEQWAKLYYETAVANCEVNTEGRYPANVIQQVTEYCEENPLKDMLLTYLGDAKNGIFGNRYTLISKLRVMFAEISVSMLHPDFVIMDEFQRFKFLISSEDESDTGILAKKFLNSEDIKILLLSATPYKLYSTLEEIDESQVDEHYAEFFQVMDFLFDTRKDQFHEVWSNYSVALHEMQTKDTTIIQAKNLAENSMYNAVCRTERISVMDSGDYTDTTGTKSPLKITEYDIKSYLEAGNLLKSMNANYSFPVDYVKSCPYLLSFMRNYKIKEKIEKYFEEHREEIGKAQSSLLWISKKKVNEYEELPKVNARLDELKRHAFSNKSELYLWVPPSRPYYEMGGVYKESAGFSKILVFSSWEMVPRMIGGMISYEAERRTVGKLSKQAKNQDKKNANYYADSNKRFPVARLRFNMSKEEVRGMNLFCLLYPSETLANMYHPIQTLNAGMELAKIEKDIRNKLKIQLERLKVYQKITNNVEDTRWYYLAPMLMDGIHYMSRWADALNESMKLEDGSEAISEKGNKGFIAHILKLMEYMDMGRNVNMGRMPDDLVDTLVNMVLGSPAICIYRANGKDMVRATGLAKIFVNRFNTTEATAIIDLAYGRCKDDNAHWQNVIRYCKDGCFQAMIDEYMHIVKESVGISESSDMSQKIYDVMADSLTIHSATYTVDTYQAFRSRINKEKAKGEGATLRSHYAVGFTKGEGDEKKNMNRKESVRNAFNSPLRPFVLATTSIGQEGLDFHNYCRKIMHWNLPSNPIDLEQREGRINRYKCLAIRQNVALKYGSTTFNSDIWTDMFEAAQAERQENQSQLVPYWCFGSNQEIKIERIVPMYPLSKDEVNYERLIKVLSLYRLTLGQARQEELLEYIFSQFEEPEELKQLFIDLSPYSKEKRTQ